MAATSLGGMVGQTPATAINPPAGASQGSMGTNTGIQSGVGQIQQGASNVGQALNQITSAVGANPAGMKKGGSVKKYTNGGKINLGSCSVSTHEKSKKSSNW